MEEYQNEQGSAASYSGSGGIDLSSSGLEEGKPSEGSENIPRRHTAATVLTFLLFSFSVFSLFLSLSFLRPGPGFHRMFPSLHAAHFPTVRHPSIASCASPGMREALRSDGFSILTGKKEKLLGTVNQLRLLEQEKNLFISEIAAKKVQFEEYRSLFSDERESESLKAGALAQKSEAAFNAEAERRLRIYLKIFQKERDVLLREEESLKQDIDELADFLRETKKEKVLPSSQETDLFYLSETKRGLLERFHLLMERNEYDRALSVLEKAAGLQFGKSEIVQKDLVLRTLSVLKEYKKKLDALSEDSMLDELKMAYLSEQYGSARSLAGSLSQGGYIGPLLWEFERALEENVRRAQEINEDIGVKDDLKKLLQKALSLEKRGENGKALEIYRDLMIFDLPPYDREILMNKVTGLMSLSVKDEMKRADNTSASRFLEEAKKLELDGMEKEALVKYRLIILQYPNSDFIEDALKGFSRLSDGSGL